VVSEAVPLHIIPATRRRPTIIEPRGIKTHQGSLSDRAAGANFQSDTNGLGMERSKNNQSRRTDTVPIQTIVRLSEGYRESMSRTGKLAVDLDARVVSVDDQPVQLTGKEYAILELLTVQKDTIVTREMLLNHLYGGRDEPELKIIDVFVCKLRKKLAQATGGDHYIATVWGRGYMLREPVATVATQTHVTMREAGLSDSSRR
jgi:DNA-binding winged helix-turn-helix (wHTH) protein